MKADEIKWGDWKRILFGEAPPAYLLEVVVRGGIIYLLIAMRVLGKRMTAEVSRAELVARVSIAAAVGLTIQRPDGGLLGAFVVVFVIAVVGRWLASIAFKNRRFEEAYQGYYATLVSDGVLDCERRKKVRITQDRLFAALRSESIRHLGEVKRFYMEANGEFSLVKAEDEQPGLSVIPEFDVELRKGQQETDKVLRKTCGHVWDSSRNKCNRCEGLETEKAFLLPSNS